MIAHINGKTETVIQEVSVEKLLSMKNIDPACVVVEVNKNIVKREKYGSVILNDGDTVEILKFVGGG
ncbi:MAG TPA: sulfur carrier protein ThiS [Chitinivibrionales bacterium]|nr:sulfur carrier protein ThiS [Chitinivibrionales bacterium]